MKGDLKHLLMTLADKYETADFLKNDPAQFMHRFSSPSDVEIMALIAATLAFGRRSKIIEKLEYIYSLMGSSPMRWIVEKQYEEVFLQSDKKFYRFYSYADMRHFLYLINKVILEYGSIGEYVRQRYIKGEHPLHSLVEVFSDCPSTKHLIPKDTHSCCKRVNMFLRWMVRDNSPVDMGLWNWMDKSSLIMPVDTHVMQQALRLHLVEKESSTLSKAIEITEALKKVWPDDPCKGDFALFGWAVNIDKEVKSGQKKKIE
jgi:uncharacterized protein (TIGR02757 family)